MWVHRTIIVNADQAELARSLCAALAGPAGEGMFTTPLSSSGDLPATHYISAGLVEDTFASILPLDIPGTEDTEAQRIPGSPTMIAQLAQQLGAEVTEAVVNDLLSSAYVSEVAPQAVLSFLNLTIIQEV